MGRRGGLTAGAAGIADQILLSIANLGVGLVLARELDPARFGVYVVAFAVALIGLSVQIALVTDPLVILGSPRTGDAQSSYYKAALIVQTLVSLATAALIGVVALAMRLAWGGGSEVPVALAGVALALPALQFQTFFRAVFFSRLHTGAVLGNDLLLSALRLAGLGALYLAGWLSAFWVFVTAGLAALTAGTTAATLCRDMFRVPARDLRETWLEHWRFGRWLLATAGAYWCSGQAPVLLASSILTPVAAAVIKACQYLVAPLNMAFNGLDGVLAPRASRIQSSRGEPALRRFLKLFALAAGGSVAVYGLALLPFASRVMDIVYKGRYSGYTLIVAILMADAFLSGLSRAPVLGLKVAGETRRIFVAYAWAAGAGMLALVTLAPAYGIAGAAAAAPISSLVLLGALALATRAPLARRDRIASAGAAS